MPTASPHLCILLCLESCLLCCLSCLGCLLGLTISLLGGTISLLGSTISLSLTRLLSLSQIRTNNDTIHTAASTNFDQCLCMRRLSWLG